MKKVVRYFLLVVIIFLITVLIIGLFSARLIYRSLDDNRDNLPPLVGRILDVFKKPAPKPVIIPRAEETIQIIEGWDLYDLSEYFDNKKLWPAKDFLAVTGEPQVNYQRRTQSAQPEDFSKQFSFLEDKPTYYGLEGYLFPDTYRVYASSSARELVVKMLSNFDKKLTAKMRSDIKAQGRSIYEVVILASIIEKEAPIDYQTGDNYDARLIAGVFLNRLKIGQGLQSDATLSYIYNDNKPAHSGAELEIDSPYNTYKYRGLPPGPICNPGLLALEAAIYPLETDYNYFLTPKGKSTVIYARTYEEHLQNKYKYLK